MAAVNIHCALGLKNRGVLFVCLDRQPSRSINIVGKDDNSVSAPEKAGNKRLRDIAGFGLGST
jgi:hypothetical protein